MVCVQVPFHLHAGGGQIIMIQILVILLGLTLVEALGVGGVEDSVILRLPMGVEGVAGLLVEDTMDLDASNHLLMGNMFTEMTRICLPEKETGFAGINRKLSCT